MVYSSSFNIQATITAGTFTHTFNINQANALVLQTVVVSVFIMKVFETMNFCYIIIHIFQEPFGPAHSILLLIEYA